MEIFASHIGEGVDLCYQKTFVSRIPWEISSGDDRGAVPCTKVEIIGGKPRWKRGEGSKGNQGGIDDENDDDIDGRIEEEKMRRSCRSLDVLEIAPSVVARRSTRRVNRRGVVFFFRKMRFRRELGDDAKNCCGGRENGLSSLIGLPNGEIWRTSARVCDFIACPSTFSYFRKLQGSHSISLSDEISAQSTLLSHDGKICRKPFGIPIRIYTFAWSNTCSY